MAIKPKAAHQSGKLDVEEDRWWGTRASWAPRVGERGAPCLGECGREASRRRARDGWRSTKLFLCHPAMPLGRIPLSLEIRKGGGGTEREEAGSSSDSGNLDQERRRRDGEGRSRKLVRFWQPCKFLTSYIYCCNREASRRRARDGWRSTKLREMKEASEMVAGPKWKNFIRRISEYIFQQEILEPVSVRSSKLCSQLRSMTELGKTTMATSLAILQGFSLLYPVNDREQRWVVIIVVSRRIAYTFGVSDYTWCRLMI
ncbi:uncharacterized protein LOC127811245 [Diospyros lotus]|uniref:uncharacterized protein LOC127811245 n=1 Tax=Diospyros lotus TaxID=55363 RepID=UPI002253D6D6|nr:uncharacterized protein LOC127811245 [Diospyros lotus]